MIPNPPPKSEHDRKNILILISFFLCLAIFVLYWQTLKHEFVFDDIWYVVKNPVVSKGLSLEGLRWAFTLSGKEAAYFHPLTWLSHMLDVEVYGLNPVGHHLTNIILHCFNTVLLLWLLVRFTKNVPASSIVALLFAVHPLNIETVAWVAERKNLLSTFFGFCTILAYGRYAEKTNPGRFLLVCLLFVLSLLAKPSLVILPLILLLLDFWPLGRLQFEKPDPQKIIRLVVEKIPLFILSIASVLLASASLRIYSNMVAFSKIPLQLRIANALVSPIKYFLKIIAPFGQSVFYPYPTSVPVVYWAGSLLLLLLGTLLCLKNIKKHPHYFFGWCWFLVGLLPVSGLLQNGLWPGMADRFVYFPAIGIFIIIGWTAANLYRLAGRKIKVWFPIFGLIITLYFMIICYGQIKTWQTPLTLFQQAIIYAPNNYVINLNYANALVDNGRVQEAVPYYEKAIALDPGSYKAHADLANAFMKMRRYEEAIPHFRAALKLISKKDPILEGQIHFVLGGAYEQLNDLQNAATEYLRATQADPNIADAYNALGIVLAGEGKVEEAVAMFQKAVLLRPEDELFRQNFDRARKLLR
jgi:protein O-mannosyl-transferase